MEKYLRVNCDEDWEDYWMLDYQLNEKLNIIMYKCLNYKEQVITKIIDLKNATSVEVYEDGICTKIIDC